MRKTIEFFERKGKRRLKEDDHARVWYADFLDFVKRERIFATMCTPAGYGAADSRWDTWRICEFAEILGFYGLQYWYTWQVSVLGLGPIWMSRNEEVKRTHRAAARGGRDLRVRPLGEGARRGHLLDGDGDHPDRRGPVHRQRTQVLHRQRQPGGDRLDLREVRRRPATTCSSPSTRSTSASSACRTSVPARTTSPSSPCTTTRSPRPTSCTRAGRRGTRRSTRSTSASTTWAGPRSASAPTRCTRRSRTPHNRRLYNMRVTDFPHVKRMFVDAYARLVAMKLVRAAGLRLHAFRLARRPALPAVQPDGEDEGDDRGRAT